ncbi:hypothetical protein DERF_012223 [Dermatophagoides farinae]|uniref:Uncharacterized protein n=1 Tax=Dermatophagoides farinae TaxID=6954 RepID=A0A922HPH7_DERFA|nr:hypothetical protein DERF_012223 [Dermatophagoides farinae]
MTMTIGFDKHKNQQYSHSTSFQHNCKLFNVYINILWCLVPFLEPLARRRQQQQQRRRITNCSKMCM